MVCAQLDNYKMNKKSYTIIELLMTTIIIVMLLALSFPSLYNIRTNSRTSECMNNARQVCEGINVYYTDCQWLPPVRGNVRALDALIRFNKLDERIWRCPEYYFRTNSTQTIMYYLPGDCLEIIPRVEDNEMINLLGSRYISNLYDQEPWRLVIQETLSPHNHKWVGGKLDGSVILGGNE